LEKEKGLPSEGFGSVELPILNPHCSFRGIIHPTSGVVWVERLNLLFVSHECYKLLTLI